MLQLRFLCVWILWMSVCIKDLLSLTQCEQYAGFGLKNGKFIKVTFMCYATQASSANVIIDVYKADAVLASECTCHVTISLNSTNSSSLIIRPHLSMQPNYASCGSRIEGFSDGGSFSQACSVFGEVPVQDNGVVTVKFLKEHYPEDDRYCLLLSLRNTGIMSVKCIDPLATTTVENRFTSDIASSSTNITVSTPTNVSNETSTSSTSSNTFSSNQIASTSTVHSETSTSSSTASANASMSTSIKYGQSHSTSPILSAISSTSSLDATTSTSPTTKEFSKSTLTSTVSSSFITSHSSSVDTVTDYSTSEVTATPSESETYINTSPTNTPTIGISVHETQTEKPITTTFSINMMASTDRNSEEMDSTFEQEHTSTTTEEALYSTVETNQFVSSTTSSSGWPDTSSRLTKLQTTSLQSSSSSSTKESTSEATKPVSTSATPTFYDETTQFGSDQTTEDNSTQHSATNLSDILTTAISIKSDVNTTNGSSDETPVFTTIASITEQTISLTTKTSINKTPKKQSPEEHTFKLEALVSGVIFSGLLVILMVALVMCARTDMFLPANSSLRKQDNLVERRSKYIVSKDTGVDNSAFNGVWLTDINVVIDESKMTMMKENPPAENDDLFSDISKIENTYDEDLTHF